MDTLIKKWKFNEQFSNKKRQIKNIQSHFKILGKKKNLLYRRNSYNNLIKNPFNLCFLIFSHK